MVVFGALAMVLRILLYVLPLLWNCLAWIVLTLYDLCVYSVERVRMWRSHSVVPRNSNGASHIREAVIGIAVCGTVYLLFSHWISKTPSPSTQSAVTAPEKTTQKGHTEPSVGTHIKATRSHRVNVVPPATAGAKKDTEVSEAGPLPPRHPRPPPPPENDDLVDVRAIDATAAARIETYCVGATEQATSRQTELLVPMPTRRSGCLEALGPSKGISVPYVRNSGNVHVAPFPTELCSRRSVRTL